MTERWKCKRCGGCCGNTPLPPGLQERFRDRAVRDYKIVEIADGLLIPKTKDHNCIFLDVDNTCRIYANRPKVCRQFGPPWNKEVLLRCGPEGMDATKAAIKELKMQHLVEDRL